MLQIYCLSVYKGHYKALSTKHMTSIMG